MASVGRSDDFVNGPLKDMVVTVSRTPVTTSQTSNGDEVTTDGTPANISAVFHKKKPSFEQTEEGLMKVQNGYVMVAPTQALNKNDKITYQGETWRCLNPVTRGPAGSVAIYTYCDTDLIS